MKRNAIYAACSILSLLSGQTVMAQNRFSFSVSLAPVYAHAYNKGSFPTGTVTNPAPNATYVIKSDSYGYTAGVMGSYSINSAFSVSTGLWATQITNLRSEIALNNENSILTRQKKYQFTYKVPLLLNYQLPGKRISPYLSAGVSADFRSRSYIIVGDYETGVKIGKPIQFNPLVGAGVRFKLNESSAFTLQPIMQLNLNKPTNATAWFGYQMRVLAQYSYRF
nr:outer membrane beta-barrel protein [uncultured Arsenicibacter sp.]